MAQSFILNILGSLPSLILFGWPVLALIVIAGFYLKWRRWPLEAVILEKRDNNLVKSNDRIRKISDDKAGMSYYELQKSNDRIPICSYDWIIHNNFRPTTIFEWFINKLRGNAGTVFLFKYGTKQYKPISVKRNGNKLKLTEVKNGDGEAIYEYRYQQYDPRKVIGDLDFDVIDWDNMNFMVQEQRASIERRKSAKSKLYQFIIPMGIIAASVVIGIFIMKFSMDAGKSMQAGASKGGSEGMGSSKVGSAIGDAFTPGK